MYKVKIFLILVILFNFKTIASSDVIEIKVKIQDQIITNIDIKNEINYLFFLNPKLRELENSRINNIAKESLITEIIKKIELEKFFDLDINKDLLKVLENNLFKRKNIKNKNEFLKILDSKNLDYEIIKQKLHNEALWNQLIYKKYSTNIVLNEKELKKEILDKVSKEKKKFSYNLSEIFFTESIEESIDSKVSKINESIKKLGFENTANIYSISNTSNKGGLIGWINELQISSIISKEIKKLNINEISKPIKIQNGYILIKLNDKKEFKQKINVDDQLKRLINNETNRQLNNFSSILYKRLKRNIDIYEY
tara:strand:+ start:4664 stop:5596 length:933 start_codon:yes stop_codon:yes gene_type:complete